eukprot:GGOE01019062.1.p1 GENE.GGOE01019062.1~~GGOE01019062.1.p1  ORF type:complete len:819 (+),score=215.40 GGOE01019062.1:65-2521(+)
MRVPFKVLKCSSESHRLPAANLESGDKFRPWCTDGDHATATLELALTRDAAIASVEVGNYGAAFIQLFVSMDGFSESQLQVLLPTTTLMSMSEVKAGSNKDRNRVFNHQLSRFKDHQKWKFVKVEVSQPFQPKGPIGLAYLILHDTAAPTPGSTSGAVAQPSSSTLMTLPTMPLTVPVLPGDDEDEDDLLGGRRPTGLNIKALQQQAQHQHWKKAAEALASPPPPSPPPSVPAAAASSTTRTLPGSLLGPGAAGGPSAWKAKLTAKHLDAKPKPKAKPLPPPPPVAAYTAPPAMGKESAPSPDKALKGKAVSQVAAVDGKAPLKGCSIVLSGFVHPLRGELQHKATSLGAKYQGDWEEGVSTHLISAYASTPKAKLVKKGWIVKKEWVEDSYSHKKRLPEGVYAFGHSSAGGGGGDESESSADDAVTEPSSLSDDDKDDNFEGSTGKKATAKAKTVHLGTKGTKRAAADTKLPPLATAPPAKKPKHDAVPTPPKRTATFSAGATKADPLVFRSPTTLLSSSTAGGLGSPSHSPSSSGGYEEWVRKDVRRLADFAREHAAKDAFTFIKEIFKKCETYLVQYDDMFDVQKALWETWEYQHELALPMAVRMLCKLDTHGLSDADSRRLVANALKSYKQQYLNALLDLLEETKHELKPKPKPAPNVSVPPPASIPATLLVDTEEVVHTAVHPPVSAEVSDTDSDATEPMSTEEQAEGLRALQCATAKPVAPLPDFLQRVTAFLYPAEESAGRRRLVRLLTAYCADVVPSGDPPATHVIISGSDWSGVKRRRGVKYVRPEWLEHCHAVQAHAAEDDFVVDFHS